MIAIAAALLLVPQVQEDDPLKSAWPKLVEAWKAIEECTPLPEAGLFDDQALKAAGKLHQAFEAAGLYAPEGEYLPQAVKAFLKQRARALAPASASDPWNRLVVVRRRLRALGAGGGEPAEPALDTDPMGALQSSLKKLKTLKVEGFDDEDNVQDELVTARKALKGLGVTADDTPPALRRRAFALVRALVQGEAYPEPAVAVGDQAKQFGAWIAELGHESIEVRDKAMKELLRAGEEALPAVRAALRQSDAEIAARCRQLLGFGHAPWKALAAPKSPTGDMVEVIIDPPGAAPPPPAPKEDKPR